MICPHRKCIPRLPGDCHGEETLIQIFLADQNINNYTTDVELVFLLYQAIATEKATAMFDQVDQDGDGELDEHEFIKLNINIIVIIDIIIITMIITI